MNQFTGFLSKRIFTATHQFISRNRLKSLSFWTALLFALALTTAPVDVSAQVTIPAGVDCSS